ncbi:hypothetical protein K456DRAFT_39084 [Colletotrichum gloeosporioides 23]|nr:hypothetical protein K456DRAFT_39084 [Colletotrichum gloeosporioides 23]
MNMNITSNKEILLQAGHKVHETSGGFEKAKWARLDPVAALDGNALLASRQQEAKAALVANHLPLAPTNLRLISWLPPAHVAAGPRRSLRPCAPQLLDEPGSHSCRDCGPSDSAISLTRPSLPNRCVIGYAHPWRTLLCNASPTLCLAVSSSASNCSQSHVCFNCEIRRNASPWQRSSVPWHGGHLFAASFVIVLQFEAFRPLQIPVGGGRSPRGSTWRITVPSDQIRRILAREINDEAPSGYSNRAGEHDWKASGGPRRADNDLGSRYGVSTFKRHATAVAERAGIPRYPPRQLDPRTRSIIIFPGETPPPSAPRLDSRHHGWQWAHESDRHGSHTRCRHPTRLSFIVPAVPALALAPHRTPPTQQKGALVSCSAVSVCCILILSHVGPRPCALAFDQRRSRNTGCRAIISGAALRHSAALSVPATPQRGLPDPSHPTDSNTDIHGPCLGAGSDPTASHENQYPSWRHRLSSHGSLSSGDH